MAVGWRGIGLLLFVSGCAATTVAPTALEPDIDFVGVGRRQLTPEGWTFIEVRQTLRNGTGRTIWISQSLWAKPAYEPAPAPTLATEPKIEPMRPLASGQSVTFHQWVLSGRKHQSQLWFRRDPRGPLQSILGPEIAP